MRLSLALSCFLVVACRLAAQDRGADEAASVRRASEQYASAICKKDAAALERLLAEDYSQASVWLPDGDKKGALGYFTAPHRAFASFTTDRLRIHLFGDTAIETGAIHASGTEYGSQFTWGGLAYSRVWLKRGGVWRVVHEHLG